MNERRKAPRRRCRLHCRFVTGRERIRARIVDVSEGGLCLLSQVWIETGRVLEIAIDVPSVGESRIRAEVWHVRRQRVGETQRKVWAIGLMIAEPDAAYRALLHTAGVAGEAPDGPFETAGATSVAPAKGRASAAEKAIDAANPHVFRVRVKATTGPRTRMLTLMASSAEEARALAMDELDGRWTVLEVKAA